MRQGIAFYAVPAPYLAFECYHIITLNNRNNNFIVAETKWSILQGQTQVESAAVGFPLLSFSCLQADVSSKQVMKAGQEVGTLRERFVSPALNVCIRTGLIASEVLLLIVQGSTWPVSARCFPQNFFSFVSFLHPECQNASPFACSPLQTGVECCLYTVIFIPYNVGKHWLESQEAVVFFIAL